MVNRKTFLPTGLLLVGVVLVSSGSQAQDSGCETYHPIRSLATANAFSRQEVNTLAELQAVFRELRSDFEAVLSQAGWAGDPNDIFQAIARGEGLEEIIVGKGEAYKWMALRRKGTPEAKTCVSWQGMSTFQAWKLDVESNNTRYTFNIPKVCANLALYGQEALPPPEPAPVCKLQVTQDCRNRSFRISTAGSTDDVRVEVRTPGGQTSQLGSRTSYSYDHDYGTYRFTASADRGSNRYGDPLRCRQEVEIETCREPLECQVRISATDEVIAREPFTVDVAVSGPVPDPRIEKVTLQAESDRGVSVPPRDLSAPYSVTETLKKAGVYTYTATATGGTEGPATCEASVTVVPANPRFSLRLFGSIVDPDSNEVRLDTFDDAGGVIDRRKYDIGRGEGFGASLEYRASPLIGVEVGALFNDVDLSFVYDTQTEWELAKDDVDVNLITGGVNFHLTPNSKVDFYIGPFIGLVNYDDVDATALGQTFQHDLDDDTALGLNLGVVVPACGKRCFSFYGGLRWLETSAEDEPTFDMDVDPLILSAGLAFHF